MIRENIRIALFSLSQSKTRSVLTLLGIIIGVLSVVLVISVGEGFKKGVSANVEDLGSRLVSISSGDTVTRDESGNIDGINPLATLGTSTLTEKDIQSIKQIPGVDAAAPIMIVTGAVEVAGKPAPDAVIIATSEDYPLALNQQISDGNFFSDVDSNVKITALGSGFREKYFKKDSPIGKSVKIKGQNFYITGSMKKAEIGSGGLEIGATLNNAVFISIPRAKALSGGNSQIGEIDVLLSNGADPSKVSQQIDSILLKNHHNQRDFSVVKQDELINVTDKIFNMLTGFVALIALISVFVGGIGVMNIMLVNVTERTREIGLRKAIGATETQIMIQFLIESMVLSLVGGFIGVALAYFVDFIIDITTDISPHISLNVIIWALAGSALIGVVSGVWPAIKAARKHPIDALRYE